MTYSAQEKAKERLLSIARALDASGLDNGLPKEFMAKLRAALQNDPLLPRSNPTTSSWQEPPHPTVSTIQSPNLPSFADFVVIGSGVTGCSVTKGLLESPVLASQGTPSRVVVLEARTLVSGATGRNGGHLVTPAGHTYNTLARRYGEETAKEMTRFSIMNVERILDMVRRMDPELQAYSEIRDVLKVMVTADKDTWDSSKESLDAFQKAVPEHNELHRIIEKDDLPERWNVKDGFGAIEHMAGAVWPYRLVTGIFQRLLAQFPDRLSIETNTPATKIIHHTTQSSHGNTDSQYPYTVVTPRGTIRTRQVVHCTNAYASHLLRPLLGKLYPFRGTMSVQKAGPYLEYRGNDRSWSLLGKSTLDPASGLFCGGLYYLQQNGITGDIWIGTDYSHILEALTSDDSSIPGQSVEALIRFLPKYFAKGWPEGEVPELKGVWSGIQGHTSDGLPLVGKLPDSLTGRTGGDGEWIAAGYSGYGMDKAWLTGEALVKMIAGQNAPEWLPKAFLITEQRIKQNLTTEKAVSKWVSIAKTGDW